MSLVGYTTGVFDLFHIGHLRVLERARDHCDRLVVGVTTDALSLKRKNKTPIIPEFERMEIVRALRCVDEVVPQDSMDKHAAWQAIGFNRMFVGDDWKGTEQWIKIELEFEKLGVEIFYFPYTQHTSSTLLRKVLNEQVDDSRK